MHKKASHQIKTIGISVSVGVVCVLITMGLFGFVFDAGRLVVRRANLCLKMCDLLDGDDDDDHVDDDLPLGKKAKSFAG